MTHNFSDEYDLVRDAITKHDFSTVAGEVIERLKLLMGADGFDDARKDALDGLRALVDRGVYKQKAVFLNGSLMPAERMFLMANGSTLNDKHHLSKLQQASVSAMAVAALKLLLCTQFLGKKGACGYWIVNTPKAYADWPSIELGALAGNRGALLSRLGDTKEYFSGAQT